jgi:hypothetical protein
MIDAIVQFLRNALCCIKDLKWFPNSIVHKEYGTYEYLLKPSPLSLLLLRLPEPLDKTSLLEFFISWTQLYACLSTTVVGCQITWHSVGKLRRLVRLLESRLNDKNNNNNKTTSGQEEEKSVEVAANRLVNESLVQQAKVAMRGVVVGIFVAPIGVAFFWLFAHSWHVTETPWLGGLLGLIDALTVMEVCLLPLLRFMIVDALDYFGKVRETQQCIAAVQSKEILSSPDTITYTNYQLMNPEWVPFWDGSFSPIPSSSSLAEETNMINLEVAAVEKTLQQWFVHHQEDKDQDQEKEQKIRQQALDYAVQTMKGSLVEFNFKGYRELVYFVLNFIAFYGYLMGIVAFYYPDDTAQPRLVQIMKFGYGNAMADWTGNFAGDLMWTIEPIVILTSPIYLSYLKQSTKITPSTTTTTEKPKTE